MKLDEGHDCNLQRLGERDAVCVFMEVERGHEGNLPIKNRFLN